MAEQLTLGFNQSGSSVVVPTPSKASGQRSISADDLYIRRWVTPWAQPQGVNANRWREFVKSQPIAITCKETLQSSLLGFDWSITARDSTQRDELKGVVKHYTKLIDRGGEYFDFGYEGLIEWILSDFLDLPFGAAAEIGRRGDKPDGRVYWIKPLDGATLFPTGNMETPVVQYLNGHSAVFPKHAVSRIFMSPISNIEREGWGIAPPEKVFFAMEMLSRGDRYYANLLGETPPAGLLDLGDMERDSAMEWVDAFREFLHGNPSSFAIPVLYEHTTDVKFIPFGKVPNDIMYDKITLKYAAIVAASYGMSLSDIGLGTTSSSGETLAGSIRQERKTRRTGIARAKKSIKTFMEKILPYSLQFNIIDPDDEVNVAMGRARLANATAFRMYKEDGYFSREELRLQTLKDGLMSQDFPEEIPQEAEDEMEAQTQADERPSLLGNPESAANGGQGEIRMSGIRVERSKGFEKSLQSFVDKLTMDLLKVYKSEASSVSEDDMYLVRSAIDTSLFGEDDVLELGEQIKSAWLNRRWLNLKFDEEKIVEFAELHDVNAVDLRNKLDETLSDAIKEFLGKSTAYLLAENLFDAEQNEYDNKDINIAQTIYKSLLNKFDDFVQVAVNTCVQNLLEKGL